MRLTALHRRQITLHHPFIAQRSQLLELFTTNPRARAGKSFERRLSGELLIEVRELIAFDQHLANESALKTFPSASRRIGREQLQKLRPLRDERMVQRYLAAVESDRAHGWHTLVYGMTLVLYSLPVRQGLLGYAHQTTRGFIHAAARGLKLKESDCRELFDELCDGIVLKPELVLVKPF